MKRTLLASLFAFGLPVMTAARAHADDVPPAPPAPPAASMADAAPTAAAGGPVVHARLVGVILSSAQALLWDEDRAEYVLHKVGEDLLGGRIVELEADHIVVDRGETREVVEIAAPPQTRVAGRRPRRMPAMIISAAPDVPTAVAAAQAAVDRVVAAQAPAAAPAATPAAALVATPAAAPAPAMVAATAPVVATAAATPASVPAAAPSVVVAPVAPAPLPTPTAAPAPAAVLTAPLPTPALAAPAPPAPVSVAPALASRPLVLARAELDRELGDFGSLSQQLQVSAQPEGGFRLSQVRGGSFFERIGLRTNDVVLRVDGRPINGVDDASAAYAWLRVANQFTVEVLRDGQPVTLRYVINGAS